MRTGIKTSDSLPHRTQIDNRTDTGDIGVRANMLVFHNEIIRYYFPVFQFQRVKSARCSHP